MASTYDFSTAFSKAYSSIGGSQEDQTLLDLLKQYLGIPPDDTSKDEELIRALNVAGAMIETYLDRVVAKQEVEEYFRHHFGSVVLHHPQVDLDAGIEVTLNGDVQSGYSGYWQVGKVAHLTRSGFRPDLPMDWRIYEQVIVSYTAGYDPIPADLAQAIIYTAAELYESEGTGSMPGGGGGSGDVKSMSIHDVGSITYDVGSSSSSGSGDGTFGASGIIPTAATQILMRYKRMAA